MTTTVPRTARGLRRLRILRELVKAPAPLPASTLASRLGFGPATIRCHLRALERLGLVRRVNYRRWSVADGFILRGFDAAAID